MSDKFIAGILFTLGVFAILAATNLRTYREQEAVNVLATSNGASEAYLPSATTDYTFRILDEDSVATNSYRYSCYSSDAVLSLTLYHGSDTTVVHVPAGTTVSFNPGPPIDSVLIDRTGATEALFLAVH